MSVSIQIMAIDPNTGQDAWYDITEPIKNTGVPFPDTLETGIYPDKLMTADNYNNVPKFYDLLGAISQVEGLKDTFFDGRVHPMRIIDSGGASFLLRVLLKSRYSSRNS